MLSTLHDTITTIGLFSLLQIEFNLTTLAAILTIAGYSVNDTVVIYDRVRETMRKYKTMDFRTLINKSLNETLSRTILTVSTVALAVLSLPLSSAARCCAASASPCCGASSSAPIPRSSSPHRCSTTCGRRAPAARRGAAARSRQGQGGGTDGLRWT